MLHWNIFKKGGSRKAPSKADVILNISATLHCTIRWYQIHVSTTKESIDSITWFFALDWGTNYDIWVNNIALGPIGDAQGMEKLIPKEIEVDPLFKKPLYRLGEK